MRAQGDLGTVTVPLPDVVGQVVCTLSRGDTRGPRAGRTHYLRYEMLDRVRTFGNANRDAFPEATGGGRAFAVVAEAVATIEAHLTRRVQARAEARKVKSSTRAAVTRAMKAMAATGRRAAPG